MTHQKTVYLIDDDPGDRHYLAFRLGALNIEAWPFASADLFLQTLEGLKPQVLLVGVEGAPHGSAGLIAELQRREVEWPIIALSRSRDVELAVRTMKMGAFDFLLKPVDEDQLVEGLRCASDVLASRLAARQVRQAAETRVTALTGREVSICKALLAGQPNKVIAHHLGISIRTVEAHRGNIMMKLSARNIAEVFMLLSQAGLLPEQIPAPGQRRLPLMTPLGGGRRAAA